MTKRTISCLVSIVLFASLCQAATFSLADAVNLARQNNPELAAAKSAWDAARAANTPAFWLPDPKIGADFERIPAGSADWRQAEMRFYNFSQAIPWPGMLWSEGQAASARSEMSGYAYQAKGREIVKQVKSAYYDLAKTDQLIKITSANLEIARQAYKTAQAKYSSGSAAQADAIKMQIELNRMEVEFQNLKEERILKNLSLNLLLDRQTGEALTVDELPKIIPAPKTLEALTRTALEMSPKLSQEAQALKEAQVMVGSNLSQYLPETMLKTRSQKVGSAVGATDIMLEFSIPLWFPVRQNNFLVQANSLAAARSKAYQTMKNMVIGEVKEKHTMLTIAGRQLRLYNASLIQSAKSLVETSLAGYRSGKTEFLDLLDGFRTYFAINKEHLETKAKYLTTLAELEEIVGIDF